MPYPPHILRRLPPRHSQITHENVSHLRRELVAQRWFAANLRVEHAVNLIPVEAFRRKQID
jgi:hypothetical protein